MPKKTREDKILARLRRLEKDTSSTRDGVSSNNQAEPKITYESVATGQTSIQSKPLGVDYSYVYKDLTKSLLFAAAAVIFQIITAIFLLN
jgi:hypothetical protein